MAYIPVEDVVDSLSKSGSTPLTGDPGGSDTQVQFNDSSAFGGDSGLTYDKTTNVVGLQYIEFPADAAPTEWNIRTADQTTPDTNANGLFISTGQGNGSGSGGGVGFEAGDGGVDNGSGGGTWLSSGDGSGVGAGGIAVVEGGNGGEDGGPGGVVIIQGGPGGPGGAGGSLSMNGGGATGTGNGGGFFMGGGSAEDGTGGDFNLEGGTAGASGTTNSRGGSINLTGGQGNFNGATTGYGGDVFIVGGEGTSGNNGHIKLADATTYNAAVVDVSPLTGDKTFTFPDQSGTFSTVTSGTSAPGSTPAAIGQIYVDTSAKKLYFSTGTASSADWTIAN
jgi:hypothetical protein